MNHGYLWPPHRAGEALAQLAHQSGLIEQVLTPAPTLPTAQPYHTSTDLAPWLEQVADQLGVETESVYATYGEVAALVQQAAPAANVGSTKRSAVSSQRISWRSR
ncbi:MAG: hypothetical protein R3C14_02740 [Caldilineaceae bacterium]